MKVKEFLTKENWTQGYYAKDAAGIYCEWSSVLAQKFCLLGASFKCYPGQKKTMEGLLDNACGEAAVWNDQPGRTFEEVKALVEKLDI